MEHNDTRIIAKVNTMTPKDEISLPEIGRILYNNWKIIVIITFFTFILSLGAALMIPPVYKSHIVLGKPLLEDVLPLDIVDIYRITPDDLFRRFLANIQSVDLQERFFIEHNLHETGSESQFKKDDYKVFLELFSNKLSLKVNSRVTGDKSFFKFSLMGSDPEKVAAWLNDFVTFTDKYTLKKVIADIQMQVVTRSDVLEKKMQSLREVARLTRLDQEARLMEAVSMAKDLLIDEQIGNVYTYRQEVKGKNEELTNIKETPSYLRGSKALKAELEVLKKRRNDDPFIPGLRALQEKLFYIKRIVPNEKGLHSVRIDGRAIANHAPIKPKKLLIVFLGSLLGGMFGIFIVLIKGIFGEEML